MKRITKITNRGKKIIAAGSINVGPITGGTSPLTKSSTPEVTFANVLTTAVGILSVIAGIWFLFVIITSGLAIIGGGDDPQKMAGARDRITFGIVGLIVVFTATIFISLITWMFGIENPLAVDAIINRIGL